MCVRAGVRVRVRACVRVCVRVSVSVSVCVELKFKTKMPNFKKCLAADELPECGSRHATAPSKTHRGLANSDALLA